ncbi:Signal transduction histidine kinase [Catalinimonas alkaloidigena]|uniref:histidine kinase n=2 Tax=Catalinimonas alkaloidigena TaxID=1075417 RepID=A0A1G9K0K3_9BACT|nr:Signal transduction histidine kinase [Catalinimonas alkaloidigena]
MLALAPLNFYMGLNEVSVVMGASGVAFLLFYYLHRFRGVKVYHTAWFRVFLLSFLIVGWFWSGGLLGSTPLGVIAVLVIYVTLVGRKEHLPFVGLMMGSVVVLTVLEFLHPEWVTPYNTEELHKIDQATVLLLCMTFTGIATGMLKYYYDAEQNALRLRNEQLKKANEELDRFVYSASHDLRAPITSMMGLVQLLKLESDPQKIRECLLLKEKSLMKIDGVIKEIVEYSRNNRSELIVEPIDVRQEVAQVLERLHHKEFDEAQPSILLDMPHDLPKVHIDRQRLLLVLNCLVSNALRFYDPNRAYSWVRIRAYPEDKGMSLQVIDNGIGIAPEHLGSIFDMFYRAHTKNAGAGLGLYIAREAVQKVGGHISATSTPGETTVFTVWLPDLAQVPNAVPTLHPVSVAWEAGR